MLVKSGNFITLDYFLNELNKRGIKFRDSLNIAINNIQKKLEDLHNKFRFEELEFQKVSPAFQWAQSMTFIYIQIKFTHRHDSPGCLEIKNQSIEIHKNMVYFKGYCVLGDVPIKFELNLELFHEINKEESTWDLSSVGRFQLNLKKTMPQMYWDRLLRDANDNPKNMKIWFEMREKYEHEIQSYMDEDDEAEFKRETDKIEKNAKDKRKRKKQEKKIKDKAQKDLDNNNQTKGNGDLPEENREEL